MKTNEKVFGAMHLLPVVVFIPDNLKVEHRTWPALRPVWSSRFSGPRPTSVKCIALKLFSPQRGGVAAAARSNLVEYDLAGQAHGMGFLKRCLGRPLFLGLRDFELCDCFRAAFLAAATRARFLTLKRSSATTQRGGLPSSQPVRWTSKWSKAGT
jgi:hypothetical protein